MANMQFRDVVKKYAGTDEALGVPAGTVGGIPVGAAASMSPVEVVTDPAAQAALSGAFAPLTDEAVAISADQMTWGPIGSGTPTHTRAGNRWTCWLMDSTGPERLMAEYRIPGGPDKWDVDLWWTNAGTGSGAIVIDLYVTPYGDGDPSSKAVVQLANKLVAEAPAQNTLKATRLASDVTLTAGFNNLMLDRVGDHVSDTLGNDAAFIMVTFTPAGGADPNF